MAVNVEVRFLGLFQQLSGKKHLKVKLDESATVRTLILKLAVTFSSEFKRALLDSELENPSPNSLILVGGKEISVLEGLETKVKDSKEIVLVPVAHGG
jgi:molybdopterin converting factor small subunit